MPIVLQRQRRRLHMGGSYSLFVCRWMALWQWGLQK